MNHALARTAVNDLKRKSVVGYSCRLGARCEVCRADGNDDGVGAVAIAGRFRIAGDGSHGDRFFSGFSNGKVKHYREDLDPGVLCDFPLVADLFPVGAESGRQRSAHSF